jgi:signal transduction histidine kinase/CHASE3 domain sensor protein
MTTTSASLGRSAVTPTGSGTSAATPSGGLEDGSHGVSPRFGILAIGLVLLIMVSSVWSANRTQNANDRVRITQTIQTAIATLAYTFRDAEVEHYNYILTSDQEHFVAFRKDLQRAQDNLARLKPLVANDEGQAVNLGNAERLITLRIEELRSEMALRDDVGLEAALASSTANLGGATTKEIRSVFSAMLDEEARLTAQILQQAERSRLISLSTLVASLAGLVIVALMTLRQANSMIALRKRAEETLLKSNQELEAEVERRTADLKISNQRLIRAQRDARIGAWEWHTSSHTLSISDEMRRLLRLDGTSATGVTWQALLDCIHPEDQPAVDAAITALRDGEALCDVDFRLRLAVGDDEFANLKAIKELGIDRDQPIIRGTLQIITERKKMELSLRQSNEELSQFAYVASHDLQEPLRMVGSYLELLNLRYGALLEGDGKEFIGYAIDGAARMKTLINDLLAFSRVSRQVPEKSPVSMDDILQNAIKMLEVTIRENDAVIDCTTPLPTVPGSKGQLTQLLQNLIGNGIKYRREDAPVIKISAQTVNGEWLFSVEDNGIGIPEEHRRKVFEIFKRLHSRDKYSGTGIGLAVCERIIQHHGGRIWAEQSDTGGSVFKFSLPTLEE